MVRGITVLVGQLYTQTGRVAISTHFLMRVLEIILLVVATHYFAT